MAEATDRSQTGLEAARPQVRCALVPADLEVGFTNEAERDPRMTKLRPMISRGFRSAQGAEHRTILRSVITTARKQG